MTNSANCMTGKSCSPTIRLKNVGLNLFRFHFSPGPPTRLARACVVSLSHSLLHRQPVGMLQGILFLQEYPAHKPARFPRFVPDHRPPSGKSHGTGFIYPCDGKADGLHGKTILSARPTPSGIDT